MAEEREELARRGRTANTHLREIIALLRRLEHPLHAHALVLAHAFAVEVALSELLLGVLVPRLGNPPQLGERRHVRW